MNVLVHYVRNCGPIGMVPGCPDGWGKATNTTDEAQVTCPKCKATLTRERNRHLKARGNKL